MVDEYDRVIIDVETRTEKSVKDLDEVTKKAEGAHIRTTELRRNMALLRRDGDLIIKFLESQGIKIDENVKKGMQLFDEMTMIVSDGARVIHMLDAIGASATSALGLIGLVIEAITVLNQLYMQMFGNSQLQQMAQKAGLPPGFRFGFLTEHAAATGSPFGIPGLNIGLVFQGSLPRQKETG